MRAFIVALCGSVPLGAAAIPPVLTCDTGGDCAGFDSSGRIGVQPGGNPCFSPGATLSSVTGTTSGTTAVQIIALSGTTSIYICSLTVVGVSGTTPTFSLVYGTGTNCATGQTVLIGAWTTAANTVYPFAYPVAIVPSGQALCYLDSGTTPVQRFAITYVQQ